MQRHRGDTVAPLDANVASVDDRNVEVGTTLAHVDAILARPDAKMGLGMDTADEASATLGRRAGRIRGCA
jgi:hypothetical protein